MNDLSIIPYQSPGTHYICIYIWIFIVGFFEVPHECTVGVTQSRCYYPHFIHNRTHSTYVRALFRISLSSDFVHGTCSSMYQYTPFHYSLVQFCPQTHCNVAPDTRLVTSDQIAFSQYAGHGHATFLTLYSILHTTACLLSTNLWRQDDLHFG
jgi:hypothetical protein